MPTMIRTTHGIVIDEREIDIDYIRASGPGGQNVNKVATAVRLRFDVRGSACAAVGCPRPPDTPGG